jgi:phage terminase Nu1 subunit (DNA packaging protein)
MVLTDGQFGDLVGCDHATIHEWRKKGRLPTPLVLGPALKAMYLRLREQAALRLGHTDGGLDLVQERAALAKAQREGVELKNSVLRGTHGEIALLERVLAASVGAVCERLDFLPAQIRTACPDLPQEALDAVMSVIAVARNDWSRSTTSLVLEEAIPEDDDEPELPLEEGGDDGAA